MFRPFFFVVFFWVFSPFSWAQFGGLYGDLFDDISIPIQAPRSHVSLTGTFNENYLVVQADILTGWHLYSVTQPGGTIPSSFKIESPELSLLEIRPTTAPRVNRSPYFTVELEEHDNSVTWILTFQEALPTDQIIKGNFDGMVCADGEGGTCIPLRTISFEAAFDPTLDIESLLAQAEAVDDRFALRVGEMREAMPRTFNVRETVNVGSLWIALLFAFLGGLILNIMPCALPVIGLKILSFFEQAGKSRARAFMLNVWYALGMLSVFLFLAFLSLGLSILFTFDLFNIIMVCIVFVMALSLMGVWTLDVPGFLGGMTTSKEGVFGAYFKGIITTLLAIPCGAPLLSPALSWADAQIRAGNMPEVFLMYGMIGIGMALPYLIIGAFPEWLRFLPKPGKWMETFTKIMGFCLLLAVVWILYFVQVEKMLPTVALLFALWFVCWLYGQEQLAGRVKKRSYAVSAIVLGLVLVFSFQIPGIPNKYNLESAMRTRIYGHQDAHWQPYSHAALESALSSGKTVIVEFTADWCVNCKVFEATVLRSEVILTLLDEKGIVSLQADCTREGEGTELLLQLGPNTVPTIAVFNPANPTEPTVERGWITQRRLTELLHPATNSHLTPTTSDPASDR